MTSGVCVEKEILREENINCDDKIKGRKGEF